MTFVNVKSVSKVPLYNHSDIESVGVVPVEKSNTVLEFKPAGFRLYGNLATAVYKKPADRDDFLEDRLLEDYRIDTDLNYNTTENMVVYNNDIRRVVVLFKGTNPKSIKDLYDDLNLALGTFGYFDTRFEPSLQLVRDVISEYPGYQIVISGHSLGAYIAYYVSREMNKESYNFALPSSIWQVHPSTRHFNWLNSFFGSEYLDKHIYTTILDPIGMMGYMSSMKGDRHIVKMKSGYYWDPHSYEHYT